MLSPTNDLKPVLQALGWLLLGLAIAMAAPGALSAHLRDGEISSFVTAIALTLFVSGSLVIGTFGADMSAFKFRHAAILTAAAWFLFPVFAALPFCYDRADMSFTDGYFEAASGLTTTGSTVISGLDSTAPSILLWRSLLQWLGGFGIIGMTIAIMPFLGIGGMQLFRLESSDRSDKAIPRMERMALVIGGIYLALSAACVMGFLIAGMSPFDALNHAMTTISTGGYSTHDASLGYFKNPWIHWVAVVFMVLGSLPFIAYYRFAKGRRLKGVLDPQIGSFLGGLAVVIAGLAAWRELTVGGPISDVLREVSFHVVSVVTTTGFAVSDYTLWGGFAATAFFFLTFVGGCTGSTAGGLKIFRFEIVARLVALESKRQLLPHRVLSLSYGGRRVESGVVAGVGAFVAVYIASVFALAAVLTSFGLDLETALSGAATAIGNVGPGIGSTIGPAGNFSSLPDGAKWWLSAGMILGRLEFMGVLLLLTPRFYRV